jgi:hypothetical protein
MMIDAMDKVFNEIGPFLKCGCWCHSPGFFYYPCMTTNRFAASCVVHGSGMAVDEMDHVHCEYIYDVNERDRDEGDAPAPSVHAAIQQLRSQDMLHKIALVHFMIPQLPAASTNYIMFSFRSGVAMARAWTLYRRVFRRLRRVTLSRKEGVSRAVTEATSIPDIAHLVTSYL